MQKTTEPFIVKTDYKNLTGFLTTKELNRRQVWWVKTLTEYYFEIEHTKGSNNTKADVFSWKLEFSGDKEVTKAILK